MPLPPDPAPLTASSDSKVSTLLDEFLLACVLVLDLGSVPYCCLEGGRELSFVEELFPGGAGADRLGIRFDAVTREHVLLSVVSLVRGSLGLGTGLVPSQTPVAVSAVLSPTPSATSLLG